MLCLGTRRRDAFEALMLNFNAGRHYSATESRQLRSVLLGWIAPQVSQDAADDDDDGDASAPMEPVLIHSEQVACLPVFETFVSMCVCVRARA